MNEFSRQKSPLSQSSVKVMQSMMKMDTYTKKSHATPLNTSSEEILFLKGAPRVTQPVLIPGGSMFS